MRMLLVLALILLGGCATTQEDITAVRLGVEKLDIAIERTDAHYEASIKQMRDGLIERSLGEIKQASLDELSKPDADPAAIMKKADELRAEALKNIDEAYETALKFDAKDDRDKLYQLIRQYLLHTLTVDAAKARLISELSNGL